MQIMRHILQDKTTSNYFSTFHTNSLIDTYRSYKKPIWVEEVKYHTSNIT